MFTHFFENIFFIQKCLNIFFSSKFNIIYCHAIVLNTQMVKSSAVIDTCHNICMCSKCIILIILQWTTVQAVVKVLSITIYLLSKPQWCEINIQYSLIFFFLCHTMLCCYYILNINFKFLLWQNMNMNFALHFIVLC